MADHPRVGLRWWLLGLLAWLLRIDLGREDEEGAHDHLREVDPILAGELAADLSPGPPPNLCPVCGRDPEDSGCKVKAEWESHNRFSFSRKTPTLAVKVTCEGHYDPWRALEALVYCLRVKVPFPEGGEGAPRYVGGGWYETPDGEKVQGYRNALDAMKEEG